MAFHGVEVIEVETQVTIASGLPAFTVVGLPDKAVAESRERVRAALAALGLALPPKQPPGNPAPTHMGWLGRELNDTLRDLVRIREVEAPDSLLLPADQQPLLREHLRVRILMARQAMLMRNQTLFRTDLADSLAIINRYFDTSDPKVAFAVAQIKSLSAVAVDVPMPTLDDSLAALRAAHVP